MDLLRFVHTRSDSRFERRIRGRHGWIPLAQPKRLNEKGCRKPSGRALTGAFRIFRRSLRVDRIKTDALCYLLRPPKVLSALFLYRLTVFN
ncbi:hypothetical protein L596_024505 [Steinernema carpocapsae]|uniref:Uncharacterized protein n=1 Tax=Steinernema carpocapsae TaxID=34508 RepID=A0A4U5MGZ2_STECR|nr:hypothetical protein L596_024505 [Steinernema carpocapsae]